MPKNPLDEKLIKLFDEIVQDAQTAQPGEDDGMEVCTVFDRTVNAMANDAFEKIYKGNLRSAPLMQKGLIRAAYYAAVINVLQVLDHLDQHDDPKDAADWRTRTKNEAEMFMAFLPATGWEGAGLGLSEATEEYAMRLSHGEDAAIDFDPARDPTELFIVRSPTEEEQELRKQGHTAVRVQGDETIPVNPVTGEDVASKPVPVRPSPVDRIKAFLESWDPSNGKGGRA